MLFAGQDLFQQVFLDGVAAAPEDEERSRAEVEIDTLGDLRSVSRAAD